MKQIKTLSLLLIFLLSITFLISCGENPVSQGQQQTQQIQNIYFDYPVSGNPIGKTEGSQYYWDYSENDFCNIYNGEFHSAEDWNLKGGNSGEIDEGEYVYSIGDGTVVYLKEEKDREGNNIGYRVVIERVLSASVHGLNPKLC